MTDDLAALMVVEEFEVLPALPAPVGPGMDLRSIDAGFALRWREYPLDGGWYWRAGMVLALAPRQGGVWVRPVDPRAGEGYAVLVDNVTSKGWACAERRLGVPADYPSLAGYQAPDALPRALVRIDRVWFGDGGYTRRRLHSVRTCDYPAEPYAERVMRGPARAVRTCFVYRGWLHPLSVRPLHPGGRDPITGDRCVPVCGKCLKDGPPK